MHTKLILHKLLFIVIIFGILYFAPINKVNWGKIQLTPASTITVTGEAQEDSRNEIATFTAGVTKTNDDKQTAVDEVNNKISKIIADTKSFGIKEEDIKTQNISIYEDEIDRQGLGNWRVSNSITLKLRDVDRAGELADLLSSSGATNVSGPRLSIDDTNSKQTELLSAAIADAKDKAEKIAEASGRSLGKVVTVIEGSSNRNVYPMALMEASSGIGGGTPVEPGSSTVSQTATVTFELE